MKYPVLSYIAESFEKYLSEHTKVNNNAVKSLIFENPNFTVRRNGIPVPIDRTLIPQNILDANNGRIENLIANDF